MNTIKVFVYGTLKPGEANYQYYCAKKVVEEKVAIALGQLYHLPLGYPGMTLGERQVHGFLLTFADSSILSHLDELEDYDPSRRAEDNAYDRQEIEIFDTEGRSLGLAWAYLMTSEQVQRLNGVLIPSGWWSGSIHQ